ncbi:hypothetical protein SAMN06297387_118125 [Streptomyces zhaozhouensis]|uniref:Uncharacterized protein n=1 Tax=Streptomyces zhaozhouensis TaxID=1300267 RepID=A0A286E1A0_9ACTN|nr:hypothetical protein [Streptomyces zhaozhouensis]SOD64672.1 hypothetical protein SAMN06297387_118125 [Streptomyces zhaozhouensis]
MADFHHAEFMRQDDHGTPVPARRRPSAARILGGALVALVVISGLVGALLLATPALEPKDRTVPDAPEAAESR